MNNVFKRNCSGDQDDARLVMLIKNGDKNALDNLIRKHQEWIYNVAVRMAGSPDDASDITQEILIKLITRLSSFRGESSFRTWLYRIIANHVLSMKRYTWERVFSSFEKHDGFRDRLENEEFSGSQTASPEAEILAEESKTLCMTGMLLCLNRTQRLVFILGGIFGIESKVAVKIMDISAENYRQILSRARKQLSNFMNEKCGLINDGNTCRCIHKTRALIKSGMVDPGNAMVKNQSVLRIRDFAAKRTKMVEDALEIKVQNLFQAHPMYASPDFITIIEGLLKRKAIHEIIDFK